MSSKGLAVGHCNMGLDRRLSFQGFQALRATRKQ